ncbi:MAG: hypothetical protein PHW08_04105 [Kiritimatiellae bacterium]|nr:hypothetical protein [Kiritimatiellia bacterium]
MKAEVFVFGYTREADAPDVIAHSRGLEREYCLEVCRRAALRPGGVVTEEAIDAALFSYAASGISGRRAICRYVFLPDGHGRKFPFMCAVVVDPDVFAEEAGGDPFAVSWPIQNAVLQAVETRRLGAVDIQFDHQVLRGQGAPDTPPRVLASLLDLYVQWGAEKPLIMLYEPPLGKSSAILALREFLLVLPMADRLSVNISTALDHPLDQVRSIGMKPAAENPPDKAVVFRYPQDLSGRSLQSSYALTASSFLAAKSISAWNAFLEKDYRGSEAAEINRKLSVRGFLQDWNSFVHGEGKEDLVRARYSKLETSGNVTQDVEQAVTDGVRTLLNGSWKPYFPVIRALTALPSRRPSLVDILDEFCSQREEMFPDVLGFLSKGDEETYRGLLSRFKSHHLQDMVDRLQASDRDRIPPLDFWVWLLRDQRRLLGGHLVAVTARVMASVCTGGEQIVQVVEALPDDLSVDEAVELLSALSSLDDKSEARHAAVAPLQVKLGQKLQADGQVGAKLQALIHAPDLLGIPVDGEERYSIAMRDFLLRDVGYEHLAELLNTVQAQAPEPYATWAAKAMLVEQETQKLSRLDKGFRSLDQKVEERYRILLERQVKCEERVQELEKNLRLLSVDAGPRQEYAPWSKETTPTRKSEFSPPLHHRQRSNLFWAVVLIACALAFSVVMMMLARGCTRSEASQESGVSGLSNAISCVQSSTNPTERAEVKHGGSDPGKSQPTNPPPETVDDMRPRGQDAKAKSESVFSCHGNLSEQGPEK